MVTTVAPAAPPLYRVLDEPLDGRTPPGLPANPV